MNKKLFGRDGGQPQLEDLYAQAEQGGDLRDVSPELHQAFAADQQLRLQLGRVASSNAPADQAIGRAAFLSAVARQKSESLEEERRPMIGQILGARGLALLAAAGIFAGGAITVGASGGVTGAAGNANDVLATLHVPHTGHGHGHGHGNSNGGGKPDDSAAPAAEGTQRAVKGIPTENPQHHPADADGICDKGETIVKTTPSGVAVNVPCQTAKDHGQGNGNSHGDKTPDANETPEANETPQADETPEANETPQAHDDGDHGQAGTHGHGDKTPEPEETAQAD